MKPEEEEKVPDSSIFKHNFDIQRKTVGMGFGRPGSQLNKRKGFEREAL